MTALPVQLSPEVGDHIAGITAAAARRDRETCFYLTGQRLPDTIRILGVVREGDPAEHVAGTHADYQACAPTLLAHAQQGKLLLGEGHRHPGGFDRPSGHDVATLREIAGAYPEYLCMIVTDGRAPATPHLGCFSLAPDGLLQEHEVAIHDPFRDYPAGIPAERQGQRVLLIGAGSLGGLVGQLIAKLPLGALTILDGDRLESRNLARHVLPKRSISKKKSRELCKYLRRCGTRCRPRAATWTIEPSTIERLETVIAGHDRVLDCTGHPVTNHLVSAAARRVQRPVLFGGVFTRGSGGYVFAQATEGACYGCLFHLTRHTITDDKATLEQLEHAYGFAPHELRAQLGLFPDVAMVASLQAKVFLEQLKRAEAPDGPNLYVADNSAVLIQRAHITPDPECITCHPLLPDTVY